MLFRGQTIQVELHADGIAELRFDRSGESVNKFDVATIAELGAATDAIRVAPRIRGVLVTSAKDVFIVGADIFEFTPLFRKPAADVAAHIRRQAAVFTAFEDLDLPIVTAINGFALGGGFEMALASDARVMSEAAQVGLPEVTLGIMPGYGGTVRLPRVAGAAAAIEWISGGKPQTAAVALKCGAVDAVVAPAELRQAALAHLGGLIESGEWRRRRSARHGAVPADTMAFAAARAVLAKGAVHQPAALAAVDLMERAAPHGRDGALALEHEAFGAIAKTQAAASLVQLFVNDQLIRKKGKAYAKVARPVKHAGVIGAGIMGGGISYTSAARGVPVVMKDIAPAALELGMAEARKLLAKQVDSGRLTEARSAAALASITPTLTYDGFDAVDVVVEAVVEKMAVKKAVLTEVAPRLRPGTVIASNTSSLSIAEMASVLPQPENVVGMHFFNPVPVMPLVEVVRGPGSSEAAIATVVGYASALGKTPIVVRECPGFLVNRIFIPYVLGFLRALHDGADYQDVDRVMEAFGWPMGPAYLNDVIGMDTMQHVVDIIAGGFPERMPVDFPHAIGLMFQQRRLGQKTGSGFYQYAPDPKGRPKKSVDPATAGLLASIQPHGQRSLSDAEIVERLMLPMIIEAAHCLEDGIVDSATEVDMGLILGLGFPRHAGGPLKYADWLGLRHVVARCEAHAALGPLYAPTAGMRALASGGRTYY
jgi:3-hydroxyacyl-CoA dehydrogenase/enoyl-CoA hydratase/3-hydroxybutyryl-CoA epimerase/enoyl-CoA isomerase